MHGDLFMTRVCVCVCVCVCACVCLSCSVAPLPRGNFTAQWIAMLKSDCPECPWWDDTRPIKGGKDQLDVVLGPNYDGTGGKWEQEFFWDEKAPVVSGVCVTANKGMSVACSAEQP